MAKWDYMQISAYNPYVSGIVGTDIKLTLKQKIGILFSKGISVVLKGSDVMRRKDNE